MTAVPTQPLLGLGLAQSSLWGDTSVDVAPPPSASHEEWKTQPQPQTAPVQYVLMPSGTTTQQAALQQQQAALLAGAMANASWTSAPPPPPPPPPQPSMALYQAMLQSQQWHQMQVPPPFPNAGLPMNSWPGAFNGIPFPPNALPHQPIAGPTSSSGFNAQAPPFLPSNVGASRPQRNTSGNSSNAVAANRRQSNPQPQQHQTQASPNSNTKRGGNNQTNTAAAAPNPPATQPPPRPSQLPPVAPAVTEHSNNDSGSDSGNHSKHNAQVAPSVEPLLSFVSELSAGLQLRPIDRPHPPITPIPECELVSLIELTYASFNTDSDLMNFVKRNFPMELCLQLRDLISFEDSSELPDGRESVLVKDFTLHRGTFVVSLIEVLGTLKSPCTNRIGNDDPTIASLTSYCPLVKQIMKHFDEFTHTQRGCIGLLRVISSTANAPRPVDRIIRAVTNSLEYLVFDSHANYIVSHVLCGLDEWVDPANPPCFVPTEVDDMRNRTSSILALASWGRDGPTNSNAAATQQPPVAAAPVAPPSGCPMGHGIIPAPPVVSPASGCSKVFHGAVPPRRAMASPQTWRNFIVRLCEVLSDNISKVGTHREASHILEHAIRRVPFGKIPDALPLLHRMVEDVEGVLAPLCHSGCGRHCVQALAETLATKSSGMKFSTVRFCVSQLDSLRGVHRPLVASSPYFDRIEAVLRRLPTFSSLPSAQGMVAAQATQSFADAFDY